MQSHLAVEENDRAKTLSESMRKMEESWFSTRRGTETMTRGSVNEEAVTASLRRLELVSYIAEVGLLARRDESYFAASTNAIAALDLTNYRKRKHGLRRNLFTTKARIWRLLQLRSKRACRQSHYRRFSMEGWDLHTSVSGTPLPYVTSYVMSTCSKCCISAVYLVSIRHCTRVLPKQGCFSQPSST